MKKNNGYISIFFEALRTATIFVSGFIVYELLLDLEKKWHKLEPSRKIYHFYKRKSIKFLIIFLIDLTILCIFKWLDVI
jgi:hypothetical protein